MSESPFNTSSQVISLISTLTVSPAAFVFVTVIGEYFNSQSNMTLTNKGTKKNASAAIPLFIAFEVAFFIES